MTEHEEEFKAIEDANIIRSGRLSVGHGHELYWVDWGNEAIKNPIFYLHGGPGAGFDEKEFAYFDPQKHRVVFHDQRGSGRSTPFASVQHNTSADLVNDITKLKDKLGFQSISLCGFSWGSTLSLLYAIANPDVVEKMLIGSIYLARKVDNDFYLGGGISSHFPEVWERFISTVPPEYQSKPSVYYKQMMESQDERIKKKFAKEWMIYESSIYQLEYIPASIESLAASFASESLSYLEAHYILNDCFIEENYIIANASKLKNIETVIVQGRYDFICMPSAALDLQRAIGDRVTLQFVPAGHARKDLAYRGVVVAYINSLWQK